MATVTNLDTARESSIAREMRVYGNSIASWQRPDNATAYAAGDVISDSASVAAVLEFPKCVRRNGGSGAILRAHLSIDVNHAAPPNFELYVFEDAPTDHLDNAALALANDDLASLHAVFTLNGSAAKVVNAAASPAGALYYSAALDLAHPFVCAADSRSLYGLLVTRSAFTPVAESKYIAHVELDCD